jgi:hypothetical protein
MSLSAKIRRAPVRAAAGAYILNSGIGKLSADDETAKRLHSTAGNSYGFVEKLDPKMFTKILAGGELAVGGMLLLPIVPPLVAGATLAGFSGLLLKTYWETPGVHEDGNPRPTPAGSGMAKDVWMLGMGTGLMLDATLSPAHDKKVEITSTVAEKRTGRARRKAKKAAKQARAETRAQLVAMAKEQQHELNKRARKAAKQARKSALDTAAQARASAEETGKQARKSALDTAAHARASAEETGKQARKSAAKAAKRARKSDAAKRARELAEQTRVAAGHGRERAADAAHRVAEVASTAAERAQDVTGSARDAAQHAAERVKQAAA